METQEAIDPNAQASSADDSVTWGLKEVLVGIVVILLMWAGAQSAGSAAALVATDDGGSVSPILTVVSVVVAIVLAAIGWLLLRLFNIPRGYLLPAAAVAFAVIGVAVWLAPSEGFFYNAATWMLPSVAYYGLGAYMVYNIVAGDGGWSQAVRKIQFRMPRNADDYLWAAGIFALTWIAVRAWIMSMNAINAPEWLLVPDNASVAIGTYGLFLLVVVSVVTAPIAEELAFRGLMFKGLISSTGFVGAVLISSVLFALVHIQAGFGILPATFIIALGMVWIYHKTRSMGLAIIAHSLSNAITLFIVLAFGSAF